MRLADATDAVPVRRLSVARGVLALPGPAAPAPSLLAAAEVAAVQAAKDAPRIVPNAHPVHLTDAFCQFDPEGDRLSVTVTVQAFARTPLSSAALAGAAAALLTLMEGLGEQARVLELGIVQSVSG